MQNYRNDRIYHFKKVFSTSRQNAIYKMLSYCNDARTKLGIEAVDRKVEKSRPKSLPKVEKSHLKS